MSSLRASMPETAAFIDECRAAFGAEMVNTQIRLGMQGAQTFYAVENGIEVGTRTPHAAARITLAQMVILSKEEREEREKQRVHKKRTSLP